MEKGGGVRGFETEGKTSPIEAPNKAERLIMDNVEPTWAGEER